MRIEATPRGIFTVFFRQFWKFFLTFMLTTSAALFYIVTTTPIYDSGASILIRFGSEAKPDVNKSDQNQPVLTQNERRELIESYSKIIQSHDLLISLINEFGVYNLYPELEAPSIDKEKAAEMAYQRYMKGDLLVKNGMQSNIIEIHVLNQNPDLANKFMKRLLTQFIVRQADVFNRPETGFINEQVRHASVQLEEAQKKLQDFKTNNGISSVENELARLMQERSDAKSVGLRSIDEAQRRVDELKERETQLLMTYNTDSPAVKRIRESLSIAYGQLRAKQADLKTSAVENNSSTLSPMIKDIDKRIAVLESSRGEFNDLQRQVQIAEENYRNYTSKLEEARINETLNQQNITRISILDEPTFPLTPVKPKKLLILVLGLLGGLILGIAIVVAFEGLDERFSRPEQITAVLGVPAMASFGRMKKKPRRKRSSA